MGRSRIALALVSQEHQVDSGRGEVMSPKRHKRKSFTIIKNVPMIMSSVFGDANAIHRNVGLSSSASG